MNRSEIAGILRVILPLVAGYAAGRGKDLSALTDPALIESLATVIGVSCAVWSVKSKRPSSSNEKTDTASPPPAA